mgnify:CR=1 FL=1
MKQKAVSKLPIVVSAIAAITTLILAIALFILWQDYENFKYDSYINDTLQRYESSKLTFCVDHTIKPCDDEHLAAWNAAHPDATFTVKSFQVIVEEGIQEYNAAQR